MNNKNYKVFYFTILAFLLFFTLSIILSFTDYKLFYFDRVNLISEVYQPNNKKTASTTKLFFKSKKNFVDVENSITEKIKLFNLYEKGNLITNFGPEESSSLPQFNSKLHRLKSGERVKLRIAYFGDSMIEGDLLTQTLRSLLQNEYGGGGVGYLPIYSKVSAFRKTASIESSDWNDHNLMDKNIINPYLSGHYFTGSGSGTYVDNTITSNTLPIEKAIIYGKSLNQVSYNGSKINLKPEDLVNRTVLSKDNINQFKIRSLNRNSILYGVSFESEYGIILDNFSFRGITGIELDKLSETFLQSVQKNNQYDLIILQYGVNMLFRPNDTEYDYYAKKLDPVLKKLKTAFENTEIIMVGSADRAFKYNGEYKTAIGLPNLIKTQATLAYDNNLCFYNLFETMGGSNSIVDWANRTPALANKDYIHPNHKGAELLAHKMFEAMQNDYKKYTKNLK